MVVNVDSAPFQWLSGTEFGFMNRNWDIALCHNRIETMIDYEHELRTAAIEFFATLPPCLTLDCAWLSAVSVCSVWRMIDCGFLLHRFPHTASSNAFKGFYLGSHRNRLWTGWLDCSMLFSWNPFLNINVLLRNFKTEHRSIIKKPLQLAHI